jgi:mono/diheme cytochrome c family protein
MDLTSAARASANPDGVIFHKVWNGRSSPRMPRFGDELSREQVWAVVAYVQSLRKRS